MSSLSNGNGAAKPVTSSKFQLPALDFNSGGSLTDGTDIPPPLPSPVQEEASKVAKGAEPVPSLKSVKPTANSGVTTSTTKPTTNEGIFSPRPISQSNASIATEKQSRRSSGWFRRLRGSDGLDSRRSSRIFVSSDSARSSLPPTAKSTGPPAPVIPEFKALGSKVDLSHDAGSLGSDLFKNIK